jgi:hypothetical protein
MVRNRSIGRSAVGVLVAAFAVALVATASASAGTCSGTNVLCIEGKAAPGGTYPLAFTQKAGTEPVFTDTSLGFKVTCPIVKSESEIVSPGVHLKSEFTFEKCTAKTGGGETCKVTSPFKTESLIGSFGSPKEKLTFGPEPGNETQRFTEFSVSHCNATVTGNWVIKGTQTCTLKQASTETTSKELACEASGSLLTKESQPIELGPLDGTLELSGESKGKKFSVI